LLHSNRRITVEEPHKPVKCTMNCQTHPLPSVGSLPIGQRRSSH